MSTGVRRCITDSEKKKHFLRSSREAADGGSHRPNVGLRRAAYSLPGIPHSGVCTPESGSTLQRFLFLIVAESGATPDVAGGPCWAVHCPCPKRTVQGQAIGDLCSKHIVSANNRRTTLWKCARTRDIHIHLRRLSSAVLQAGSLRHRGVFETLQTSDFTIPH